MFCKHKFEFVERATNPHYWLLLYYSHSDYYYRFKCRKCGKIKDLPVSFEQYHEKDAMVVCTTGMQFKIDELNIYKHGAGR